MNALKTGQLENIQSFQQLVPFLRDELDWPIDDKDFVDLEDVTYEYDADELHLKPEEQAKIREIRQLRPLVTDQPWGIFFVSFESEKNIPVVVLRRILRALVVRKRQSANATERKGWDLNDLLFISAFGGTGERELSFAHFSEDPETGDLAVLRVLGWDSMNTRLHLANVYETLKSRLRWPDEPEDTENWRKNWAAAFVLKHREVISTSKALAIRLADLAKQIRDRANAIMAVEPEAGPMRTLHEAFRESLIHDLDEDDFADMFAQTIAYGLLTARISRESGRLVADDLAHMVPATNPFLKELFETFLALGGRSKRKHLDFDELGIDDVVETLRNTKMEAVLSDFGDRNPHEDPVIHFYELFLKEYDAKKRMQRGVFYTPRPVVSFIVRSVDEILRTEFKLKDGLADTATWGEMAARIDGLEIPEGTNHDQPFVQILDPATGTGTFLVEVIEIIHWTVTERWKEEGRPQREIDDLWNKYVPESLLPRLHGYELMMAPYAIAHMKIGLKLVETGYRFTSDERARVYLTNSLEPPHDFSSNLAFAVPSLAHEANAVNKIKDRNRFTVIIGNPPYSKMSGNMTEDATKLIEPFRYVDGERIVERGALALELNLQDDYVKFWGLLCNILFGTGLGVGVYITNSRYLASASLRGLRRTIENWFTKAAFVNLGGQVSERKTIDGPDDNVFDIEQGVAVGAIYRTPWATSSDHVNYSQLTGKRAEKYLALLRTTTSEINCIHVTPSAPLYIFSRNTSSEEAQFYTWPSLADIMPINSGSIITSRDNLAIDFEENSLLEKIEKFAESGKGDSAIQREIGFSVKQKWDVESCKKSIKNTQNKKTYVKNIIYRPFDYRKIYYSTKLLDTPSRPICESVFDHDNLVLLTPGVKTSNDFSHIMISRVPSEKKSCSHDRATQMFPMYIYETGMFGEKKTNISPSFSKGLARVLYDGVEPVPTDVINFIYAIVNSGNCILDKRNSRPTLR